MKSIFLVSFFICFCIVSKAQLLAFPTAEGAGKFVTGGRGSAATAPTIFEVTKLTDDGSVGTLRYACTNNSPAAANRIIVFRVAGTIRLTSALTLTRANTTIAGQTAPGDGICIADYPVYLGVNNIIIRYIRFRLGDKNQLKTTPANCGIPVTPFAATPSCIPTANASGADDAFGDNGNGRTNIIIDHCSMSWSNDEAFTFYKGNNVTLQWNILSEPLNFSYHVETGDVNYQQHAFGGIWGGAYTTAHHNLLAHCKGRMPRFDGTRNLPSELVDFRNNVIYDWADYNTNGGEGGNYNVVNNYYKYGPSTASTVTGGINRRNMLINPYKSGTAAITTYGKYFLTGNYCDNSAAVTADNWQGVAFNNGIAVGAELAAMQQITAHAVTNSINTETAQNAYNAVLQKAGCNLPNRDTLDARIVNDVINRTGGLIDCQGNYPHATPYPTSQTAWPTLAAGFAPTDTDHDGMPDAWETQRGLNPNSNTDLNNYTSTTGYNNVETYLNGDTITAAGILNTCVTTKSFNVSNTGNWIFARDTSRSSYNLSTYLASTDSNNVAASILDNGNFGKFTVSYYTTNVVRIDPVTNKPYLNRSVTITPENPLLITAPVTVRIYISKKEFDDLKAADATINTINDVNIIKVTGNNCAGDLSAGYTVISPLNAGVFGSYANGYYVEFQTSSFSTFYIGSKTNFVLPLRLLFFTAALQNKKVIANWKTDNEINTFSFNVERSDNGRSFSSIGIVPAVNASGIHNYQFTDELPFKGISYYRLKSFDIDGKFSYSNIVKINDPTDAGIKIIPNPVSKTLTLYHASITENAIIKVLSVTGELLLQYKPVLGSTISEINVSLLHNGIYTLVFTDKNNVYTNKFFKID